MAETVWLEQLGMRAYQAVWDYQERLLQQNLERKAAARLLPQDASVAGEHDTIHHLLFTEHFPVYTLGKSGKPEHVLISAEERAAKGVEYFHINRGGDITFHGPQQLVVYPVFDLEKFRTDLGWYLRSLEEVVIRTLAAYGLQGARSPGETGVWLDPQVTGRARKICAMGIRCSRWITMHGLAFNINTNLDYFNYIVPCGIANKQVTSLEKELGHPVDLIEVEEMVKHHFEQVFGICLRMRPAGLPAELPR